MARVLPKSRPAEQTTDGNVAVLAPDDRPLRLNQAGLDLIRRRLEAANRDNPDFAAQRDRLLAAVTQALDGLLAHFAPEIERVVARGDWALEGIDLRALPDAEDIVLEIVHRSERPSFPFAERVSRTVWSTVRRAYIESFLLQFSVLPLPQWRHALTYAQSSGWGEEGIGIPLLTRE